ncbi:MAG: hypothetical protein V3U09_08110 [Thermoplasmata archaeon]
MRTYLKWGAIAISFVIALSSSLSQKPETLPKVNSSQSFSMSVDNPSFPTRGEGTRNGNQTVLNTTHFFISYQPGSLTIAEEVSEILEELYADATAFVNHTPQRKANVTLNMSIKPFYEQGYSKDLFGFTGGVHEDTILLGIPPLWAMESRGRVFRENLETLLAHEYNHFLLGDATNGNELGTLPRWFVEGLASFFDYQYVHDTHEFVPKLGGGDIAPYLIRIAIENDTLMTLDEMQEYPSSKELVTLLYAEGYSITKFMVDNHHQEAFHTFLESMKNWNIGQTAHQNVNRSTLSAFDKTIGDFEEEWFSWLEENYSSEAKFGGESASIKGTRVTDNSMIQAPSSWSRDGRILFTSGLYGNLDVFAMDDDGSNIVRLTMDSASDMDAEFSPDEGSIAFVSLRDGFYNIYAMNGDGSNVTQLTNDSSIDIAPCWSPLEDKIAFVSDRMGDYDIYTMNIDGTSVQLLIAGPHNEGAPNYSPDGEKLAFSSDRYGNLDIFILTLSDGETRQLTETKEHETFPVWSPDGKRIAFQRFGMNGSDILIVNEDGSKVKPIVDIDSSMIPSIMIDGFSVEFPVWSPNSRGIALTFTDRGKGVFGDVFIVDVSFAEEAFPVELAVGFAAIGGIALIIIFWKKHTKARVR